MNEVTLKDRAKKPKLEGKGHDPWSVDVYVYLQSGTLGDFSIESYLQSNPTSKNLIFYNRHHPGFIVNFHLIDETNSGYRFPLASNAEDGIWSQMGDQCPTSDNPVWDVFTFESIKVSDQGMTLSAYNPNVAPVLGDFRYTLNVSQGGTAPYLPLDPGGTNQNGSTTLR